MSTSTAPTALLPRKLAKFLFCIDMDNCASWSIRHDPGNIQVLDEVFFRHDCVVFADYHRSS
jgi:hypothetical protein